MVAMALTTCTGIAPTGIAPMGMAPMGMAILEGAAIPQALSIAQGLPRGQYLGQ